MKDETKKELEYLRSRVLDLRGQWANVEPPAGDKHSLGYTRGRLAAYRDVIGLVQESILRIEENQNEPTENEDEGSEFI